MKGFILKDLLVMKGNLKSLLIILLGFVIMAFNGMTSLGFVLTFFLVMMCISTFSYDEYNKWDAYAISLPGGRKEIVKSKYIMTIILAVLGSLITFAITCAFMVYQNNWQFNEACSTVIGNLVGILLVVAMTYPLIYKFGNEKGRIYLFLAIFLIGIVGGFVFQYADLSFINLKSLSHFFNQVGWLILPLLGFLCLYISYFISLRIYCKKEF